MLKKKTQNHFYPRNLTIIKSVLSSKVKLDIMTSNKHHASQISFLYLDSSYI